MSIHDRERYLQYKMQGHDDEDDYALSMDDDSVSSPPITAAPGVSAAAAAAATGSGGSGGVNNNVTKGRMQVKMPAFRQRQSTREERLAEGDFDKQYKDPVGGGKNSPYYQPVERVGSSNGQGQGNGHGNGYLRQ
ncbi:hypothetical protein BGZ70_000760 [Mortierella alpina]|uniref:Uncharacterized protein n=1 Tax=Mortierella alpina TaxID=64518 RepID=A0A9P6IX62_MORAP|nr:hypothetical protein BGZ70_000760 [Mortierella alpina]